MKVKHIRSKNIWLMSRGDRILCRSRVNPWKSQKILALALSHESFGNESLGNESLGNESLSKESSVVPNTVPHTVPNVVPYAALNTSCAE